jgi:hypothetical protein
MRRLLLLAPVIVACGEDNPVRHLDAALRDTPASPDGRLVDAGLAPCTKPANKALSFAGSQWVQIADSTSLHTTDLTVEAWTKFTGSPSGYQVVVAKPYGSSSGDSFALWLEGGALNAGVNPTSPADAISKAFTPAIGQWYQLTFTYDHTTSEQRLYVDGTLLGSSTTTSAPIYDTQPVVIGGDINGGAPGGFIQGECDEQ